MTPLKQIDVRPFKSSDLIGFYDGTIERKYCEMDAKHCQSDGPSFSFYAGDILLACAGIRIFWPGVGEAWLCCSPGIENYKRELIIYARAYLAGMIKNNGLWRVECNVRADFPNAIRLVKKLGFSIEGKRKQYGVDKADCFLYSIVR
jgi:hypothetical protein